MQQVTKQQAQEKALEIAGIEYIQTKPKKPKIYIKDFSPVPFGNKIMEDDKFIFDNNKNLWRFNKKEGIWTDDAELYINSLLRKELMVDEQQKRYYVTEIIEYIKGICWSENDITKPPKHIIAFQNVLYDLNDEDFKEFTHKYFITSKIPVEINAENTDFYVIDSFIEDILGKEQKKIIYELMAYCLYRAYPYQKFFIFYGEGKNGKSALLKLITKFLGAKNVSHVKPQTLSMNRFASAELFGKLANISPDIPYTEINNTDIIRELTGEDKMSCDRKHKNPFDFYNYAKIIFSANELPQIKDRTYAFNRRIYIIKFEKKIENPEPEIVERIATPTQMSGLGWHLIKVLTELKKKSFQMTMNMTEEQMAEQYDELSNRLLKFLKEETERKRDEKIADWELKEKFTEWCDRKGLRVWKVGEINRNMAERFSKTRMNQEFYNKETGKLETKFVHAWEGLKWKN